MRHADTSSRRHDRNSRACEQTLRAVVASRRCKQRLQAEIPSRSFTEQKEKGISALQGNPID